MSLAALVPYLIPALMLAATLGALWVFRRAAVKELAAIQGQIVEVYKEQNAAQEQQIKRLRAENIAMRAAFKQLGVEIEMVDEHEIILVQRDPGAKRTRITNIRIDKDADRGRTTQAGGSA